MPDVPPLPSAVSGEPARTKWLAVAGVALCAFFLCLSVTPLGNSDVWVHMAVGRWILANGEIPLTDPFSFSAEGQRFYAHEWLPGVVFHAVHSLAGVGGLILFKTALAASALGLAAASARRLGASWPALLGSLGLALVLVSQRLLVRPEMFSYVLTALCVAVLVREHERLARGPGAVSGVSLIWWLVPAQWLWVQSHGYFLTGLAMVGAFLAAEIAQPLLRLGPAIALRRWLSGVAALVALFAVGFLNPNGWEIYTYPLDLVGGQNVFTQTVFEWKPTFTTPLVTATSTFLAFCLWLGVLTVSCLDHPPLLRRVWLWRGVCAVAVALVLAVRLRPGAAAGWLRSPGELLAGAAELPGLRAPLDAALAPLRLLGGWGDDALTLLALLLAGTAAVCWRRPAAAGLVVGAVALALVLQTAGGQAEILLALVLVPALLWPTLRGVAPLWQVALTLLFLGLAVRQNRNIANLALATLPFLAVALTRAGRALAAATPEAGASRRGWAPPLAALAALFSALAVWTAILGWPYVLGLVKRPGLGVGGQMPVAAVDYVREAGIRGRAFNEYTYGAYLIHELYPETRVFMDSRAGVYGPALYSTYLATLQNPRVAERVFARHEPDYVILDYAFHYGPGEDSATRHAGLFAYLAASPDWVLSYFDDQTVIYLPDRPENAERLARDGYRLLSPVGYRVDRVRSLNPRQRARYGRESARALERQPGSVVARLIRADYLAAEGRAAAALVLLEGALERAPDPAFVLVRAADLARSLGRIEEARAYYRRALERRPAWEAVRRRLERLDRAR